MFQILRNAWKIEDLRKKLLFTVFILLIFRIGSAITVPFVDGRITVGPWQNLTLVECDTRNRVRDIVFQVMGE